MTFTELIRTIFLSPDEPRLRSGWRIAVQMAVMLTLTLVFSCGLGVVMVFAPETNWLVPAMILGTGLPVLISVPLARKLVDRRPVQSLGLQIDRRTWRDLLIGIGIAALQIGLIFGLELAFGWVQVTGYAWQEQTGLAVTGTLKLWLLLFIAVGFYEEFMSRGYHLQNLEEGTNTFWAVLISSLVFGVGHVLNPNASCDLDFGDHCGRASTWRTAICAPAGCGCRSGCISAGTSSWGRCSASLSPDWIRGTC